MALLSVITLLSAYYRCQIDVKMSKKNFLRLTEYKSIVRQFETHKSNGDSNIFACESDVSVLGTNADNSTDVQFYVLEFDFECKQVQKDYDSVSGWTIVSHLVRTMHQYNFCRKNIISEMQTDHV